MKTFKDILDGLNLDKNLITEDVKSELQDIFESEVKAKATEIANEMLEEKLQEERTKLEDEYTHNLDEEVKKIDESVTNYLDIVVEEYIKENSESIDKSIDVQKMKAILELFETMVKITGVSLDEAVSSETPTAVSEYKEKINELTDKVIGYKKANAELAKMLVLEELLSDSKLPLSTKEKIKSIVENMEFDVSEYSDSIAKIQTVIDTVAESVNDNKEGEELEKNSNINKNVNESSNKVDVRELYKQFV